MRSIVILMLVLVSSSAAAEWVRLTATAEFIEEEKSLVTYVDPATIERSGDTVKMRELFDFTSEQVSTTGLRYLSATAQYEYDCKGSRYRILEFTWFSEKMGLGKAVYTRKGETWRPVATGTIGLVTWKYACGVN